MSELLAMLVRHEGVRLFPYTDTVGKLTIGVGRNLTDKGITRDEAEYLLSNDVDEVRAALRREFYWYTLLTGPRQDALADMCFNLGLAGLRRFSDTLAAVEAGRYEVAAAHMLNSTWREQVGGRAEELAQIIRTGQYSVQV
jgi:lysozyme